MAAATRSRSSASPAGGTGTTRSVAPAIEAAGLVGVVGRFERENLVAHLAQSEQGRGDGLGGAGGDEHLAVGVDGMPQKRCWCVGDGGPQLGDARARRVLVVPAADGRDRGLCDLSGPVGVGEALAQVDGAGLDGERRHLGEDRGAETLEPRR